MMMSRDVKMTSRDVMMKSRAVMYMVTSRDVTMKSRAVMVTSRDVMMMPRGMIWCNHHIGSPTKPPSSHGVTMTWARVHFHLNLTCKLDFFAGFLSLYCMKFKFICLFSSILV